MSVALQANETCSPSQRWLPSIDPREGACHVRLLKRRLGLRLRLRHLLGLRLRSGLLQQLRLSVGLERLALTSSRLTGSDVSSKGGVPRSAREARRLLASYATRPTALTQDSTTSLELNPSCITPDAPSVQTNCTSGSGNGWRGCTCGANTMHARTTRADRKSFKLIKLSCLQLGAHVCGGANRR